ncbi:helix-turn-helix family protein [Mycobacterium intracellulare 1956]|uniref:Helix-turn-helix family protein n=1 Tax=Mycobacterium intracellulare 1956 TaxID=1299331 RepID=X8CI64_MYCIT|nr:helix-turn-helix family protein [Mycobacterium intracellulare 1956]
MPPLVREVIGDVLREARTAQGRTLREVSDSARVSLGYLSEVERGRKEPSSELLNAICDALDVPLSSVLTDAGERMAGQERAHERAPPACPPTRPRAAASTSAPRSSFRRWRRSRWPECRSADAAQRVGRSAPTH